MFFQDKVLRLNELNALRKQIEREYLEKVKLEDEILEKLRSQLTLDKASQYTDKLTGKLRSRTKDLVSATQASYLLTDGRIVCQKIYVRKVYIEILRYEVVNSVLTRPRKHVAAYHTDCFECRSRRARSCARE